MGTTDVEPATNISIITLDAQVKPGVTTIVWDDPSLFTITSQCRVHVATETLAISWSGVDLNEEDGWYDLANGTLFARTGSSIPVDPFGGYREARDDVELEASQFIYQNGHSVKGSTLAVYHMIFPQYYEPTRVEYLRLDGLEAIHARVLSNRAIFTWVYRHAISLRISFKRGSRDQLTRHDLYRTAIENLPKSAAKSEFVQEIERGAAKQLVESVPKIIKVLGSLW